MMEGGNTGQSLRGNPETVAQQSLRIGREGGKPRKGWQARKSQADLPAGKTLEGSCRMFADGSEAQERIGFLGRPAGRRGETPREGKAQEGRGLLHEKYRAGAPGTRGDEDPGVG